MKKALLASAACAALGLATVSQAAVVASWTSKGTPTNGSTVATGYTGWILTMTSDSGNIQSFDLSSTQNGQNGLKGPFVQRWTASNSDGVYDTVSVTGTATNATSTINNFDSHLLGATNFVGAIDPSESLGTGGTMPPSGTALPPFPANSDSAGIGLSGLDGSIRESAGINGPVQATTLQLAYVVLPNTFTGTLGQAQIATANGTFNVPIPGVPEPVSASLLGLGALGLVARRRRA